MRGFVLTWVAQRLYDVADWLNAVAEDVSRAALKLEKL